MKVLTDGKEVPARGYYYLLDWNETDNWKYISTQFNKTRLCDLTIKEYYQLFCYATQMDSLDLIKSF